MFYDGSTWEGDGKELIATVMTIGSEGHPEPRECWGRTWFNVELPVRDFYVITTDNGYYVWGPISFAELESQRFNLALTN